MPKMTFDELKQRVFSLFDQYEGGGEEPESEEVEKPKEKKPPPRMMPEETADEDMPEGMTKGRMMKF